MTSQPSILIIANPISGKGRGRRTAEAVLADLRQRGLDAEIRYTEHAGDAAA